MVVTRKSLALLVIAFALRNTSLGQQSSVDSQFPPVPALTCRTVQLQSLEGTPVAHAPVHLKVAEIKDWKGNIIEATVTFKLFKKVKSDAAGRFLLPDLKPDTYYLELPEAKKRTSGAFAIPDDKKLRDCTQTFVLKDRGNMVHIEPSVSGEAADKK